MLNEYEDHWITTYSGKKMHYLEPKADEICIEDIAHALALTCRFGGHCKKFYSVAEHSIRVAEVVEDRFKLRALLHDAHEAYLHDVPRPIKQDMPQYKTIADRLQRVILIKFPCNFTDGTDEYEEIKFADNLLLSTEKDFMMTNVKDWAILPDPLKPFEPMSWRNAERQFLKRFKKYTGSKK